MKVKLNIQNRMLVKSLLSEYQGTIDGVRVARLITERCTLTPFEIDASGYGYVYQCDKCKAQKHFAEGETIEACWMDGCDCKTIGRYNQPVWKADIFAEIDLTQTGAEILKKKLQALSDGEALDMKYASLLDLLYGEFDEQPTENTTEQKG